jgi:hypothetical protein
VTARAGFVADTGALLGDLLPDSPSDRTGAATFLWSAQAHVRLARRLRTMKRLLFFALVALVLTGSFTASAQARSCHDKGCYYREMPSPTTLTYECQPGCQPYQGPIPAPRFYIPLPPCGCDQKPCITPCKPSRCGGHCR